MRNTLLFGTAALALALTSAGALAAGAEPVEPNIYDPAFQASNDVQPPRAVLGAHVGTNYDNEPTTTLNPALQQPRYVR